MFDLRHPRLAVWAGVGQCGQPLLAGRRTRWIDPFRLSELGPETDLMSLSASELFEAVGQGSVGESWTAEIGSRVDDMVGGEVQMVPGEAVFAELADRLTGLTGLMGRLAGLGAVASSAVEAGVADNR